MSSIDPEKPNETPKVTPIDPGDFEAITNNGKKGTIVELRVK